MELANIERLLEAYFEGNTTLEEEKVLHEYFTSDKVAPQLGMYQPLFEGMNQARMEVSKKEINLPKPVFARNSWWYSIAAMLVIGITVGGLLFSQPRLTQEERDAIAAFEKTKATFQLLSESLNKGTEDLAYINEFTKGTSSITHINQFTDTKNKILK